MKYDEIREYRERAGGHSPLRDALLFSVAASLHQSKRVSYYLM